MKKKLNYFLSIFIIGIALDQLVKYWAVASLKGNPPMSLMGGFVKLVFATNKGAWGSAGGNLPEPLRSILLIFIPACVLVGLVYYILKSKDLSKSDLISYSLIASGGVGNIIDRIIYNEVVDMFWFGLSKYKYLQTNVFNIADILIMAGFFIFTYVQIKDLIQSKRKKNS